MTVSITVNRPTVSIDGSTSPPSVTVTPTTTTDPTKLPLAGGTLTGDLQTNYHTEQSTWPLDSYLLSAEQPPLVLAEYDGNANHKYIYDHRGHIVFAVLDAAGAIGTANTIYPYATFAPWTSNGITFPTALRWNNEDATDGGSGLESGIRTGKGTSLWLDGDYQVGAYADNTLAFTWTTTGLTVASGLALKVGSDTVMLDVADAVDSANYTDGSIDTAHLSADCVDGTKLADNAVDSEHYTDGSIDAEHLADGAAHANSQQINTQTGDYTLVLADKGKIVEMNKATANTLTVPPNSSVAFPTGSRVAVVQYGAGTTTVAAGVGVTVRSLDANLDLSGQYAAGELYKRGTDEWVLVGSLA